jgi:hypothetical protein
MNKWMKRLGLGAAALALPLSTVAVLGSGNAGAATTTVTYSGGATTAHKITITVNSGLYKGTIYLHVKATNQGLQHDLNCTGTAVGTDAYTSVTLKSVNQYSTKVATFAGRKACVHIPVGALKVSAATAAKTLTIIGTAGVTATYITVTGAPATCRIYTGSNFVIHNLTGLSPTVFRQFKVTPTPTTLAFHIPAACTTATINGISSIKISGSETANG